jgi:aryl-alcohol dehydrogenase-like predicted oxidoreductase
MKTRRLGKNGLTISAIGRDFLTGAIKSPEDFDADDYRRASPRFQGENFKRNLDLVRSVEQMAKDADITPSQLALAWVLGRGDDIVPIPGSKRCKYIEENAAAVDISLSPDVVRRLQEAFPPDAAAGDMYQQ